MNSFVVGRREHVDEVPRPACSGLLAVLRQDGIRRAAEDTEILLFVLRIVRPAEEEVGVGADVVVDTRNLAELVQLVGLLEREANQLRAGRVRSGGRAVQPRSES